MSKARSFLQKEKKKALQTLNIIDPTRERGEKNFEKKEEEEEEEEEVNRSLHKRRRRRRRRRRIPPVSSSRLFVCQRDFNPTRKREREREGRRKKKKRTRDFLEEDF